MARAHRQGPRWETHHTAAEDENIAWLQTPEGGSLTLAAACARVGVTVDTYLQRTIYRQDTAS